MTTKSKTPHRILLAAAAFGLASLGLAGAASASPVARAGVSVDAGIQIKVRDRDPRTNFGYQRYDHRREIDPYRVALRRYDRNHNRILDVQERRDFWTFMAGSGVYGSLSSEEVLRFGQLAGRFDVNSDGRLIGVERRGMDRLITSMRLFERLDRNNDRRVTAYEAGYSSLAPRFRLMDENRDRVITLQEVRDDVLRAYRAGEC